MANAPVRPASPLSSLPFLSLEQCKVANSLERALLSAKSLSLVATGECGEAFRDLHGGDQDAVMGLLSDLLFEIEKSARFVIWGEGEA